MTDTAHTLIVTGPHPYPGGKDGWYLATCSCGKYAGHWGPTEAQAAKPAKAHIRAKTETPESSLLAWSRAVQRDERYYYQKALDNPGDYVILPPGERHIY